ncbi:MAG: STAS domain-containing protein [Mycobacteriales bacterium]
MLTQAPSETVATGGFETVATVRLELQIAEPVCGQVVITVRGTLNVLTNPRLRESLRSVSGRSGLEVVVDLTGATLRDSSALVTLHAAQRRLHEAEGRLILRGLGESARRAFARAGLAAMLGRCAA